MSLQIVDLSTYYGQNVVLNNFHCNCKTGTTTAIYGDNASGKTTLLSTIAGIHRQYTGTIQHQYTSIGYATDTPILFEEYTAREHFLYIHRLHKESIDTTFRDIFGLDQYKENKISTLSHGNRQKISLVCSLIGDSALLLRDEPCNGLDKSSRNKLAQCMQNLKEQKKTIVITTHIDEDIEKTIDQKINL